MEATTKKRLIKSLERLIDKIKKGHCDRLSLHNYDKLMGALGLLLEIEIDIDQHNK